LGTGLAFPYGRVSALPYARVQLHDRVNNKGKTRARAGVTPPPFIPETVDMQSCEPLFIVEAPPKALSMASNGFPNTIGCGGVSAGFFVKGSSKIQADLLPFLRASRRVYIVFDAGRVTNVWVAKAEAKIARALLDLGIPTFVVELPFGPSGEDQGPDDFLVREGAAVMAKLVQQASPAVPGDWAARKVNEGPAAARALLEHLPFAAALCAAGPGEVEVASKILKAVTDKRELRALCDRFKKAATVKLGKDGGPDATAVPAVPPLAVGDHVEVARKYLKTLGDHVVFADGAMYVYVDGVWRKLDSGEQKGVIADYSGTPVATNSGVKPLALEARDLTGIVAVAGSLTAKPDFFTKAPDGLAFKNGFLSLDGAAAALLPHSADNRARFAYDFDYDAAAPSSQWDTFLNELWDGDDDAVEKRDALQEFFGAALFGVAPRFKKCIVVAGDTDSGKSTCLHIMRGVFPPGTTEAIAPGEWTSDYKRACLAGKLLNTVAELPEKEWIETESFKAFVGDDAINARQIYGVPFTYFSRAAHIFAANALPRVADRSNATWNRMIVISCNNRFYRDPAPGQRQARDGLATAIVEAQKAGIIVWAVRGLERLLSRGRYTHPASSLEVVQRWKENSDQLEEFFAEMLEVNPKSNLPVRAVYDTYRGWATNTNHRAMASERFREAFVGFLQRKTGDKEPKYKSHGVMAYRGIRQRPVDFRETQLHTVPEGTWDPFEILHSPTDRAGRGPQRRPS
jgi:putative DNA primase/helicase